MDIIEDSSPCGPDFWAQQAPEVARQLIGCSFVHQSPYGPIGGMIAETEAYLADDPASHSFNGPTPRCAPMFLAGGHVYAYLSYGMHICLNFVTGQEGVGEAVLIRSVIPRWGLEQIYQLRRRQDPVAKLTDGPGKVGQGYAIRLELSGMSLEAAGLRVYQHDSKPQIQVTPRIGISKNKEAMLRFVALS